MTLSSPICVVTANGNDATLVWPFDFLIPYQADGTTPAITVEIISPAGAITSLILGADFTLVGAGPWDGGTINYPLGLFPVPLPSGWTITIARSLDYVQPVVVENQAFYPPVVESTADLLAEQTQQLARDVSGALRLPLGEAAITFPPAVLRKGGLAYFDTVAGQPTILSQADARVLFQGSPGVGGGSSVLGLFSAISGFTISGGVSGFFTSGYASVGIGTGFYTRTGAGPANTYTAQSADGAWWVLTEAFPNAYQFGALNDGSVQDAAIAGAIAYSVATGRTVFFPGSPNNTGGYGVSTEHRLDGGSAGFFGASLVGEGWERSFFINYASTAAQKLFSAYGGSGTVTNKSLVGFTFKPAGNANVGKGICLYMDGQTGMRADIQAYQPYRMFDIETVLGGNFAEYNELRGWSLNAADAAWNLVVNGGTFSFHGNKIEGVAVAGDGQVGVRVRGISQTEFLYGITWDLHLFGQNFDVTVPTTAIGIYADNVHAGSMTGQIECEGPLIFQSTSTGQFDGGFGSQGVALQSISALTFTVAAGGIMRFGSVSADAVKATQGPFTSTQLVGGVGIGVQTNTLSPLNLGDLSLGMPLNKSNTDAPAAIGYINPATGDAGVVLITQELSGSGVMIAVQDSGNTVNGIRPTGYFLCNGSRFETYPPFNETVYAAGGASGATTGMIADTNGRFGGTLGRKNPLNGGTDYSIAANGSVRLATSITTDLIDCDIRFLCAAHGVDLRYRLCWCASATGGASVARNMNATDPTGPIYNVNPGGGFATPAIADFTVDSAGHLNVAITTNALVLITYKDITFGNVTTR